MKPSQTSRFTLRAAAYLMLFKENKILLLKRCNTGWMDEWYSLPAGHFDGKETATEAVIREAREEVGVEVKKQDLKVVHVMHRKSDSEYVDFFFVPVKWKNEPKLLEKEKSSEVKWFPLNSLPKNTVPYIKKVIDCYNKKIFYSEEGW